MPGGPQLRAVPPPRTPRPDLERQPRIQRQGLGSSTRARGQHQVRPLSL